MNKNLNCANFYTLVSDYRSFENKMRTLRFTPRHPIRMAQAEEAAKTFKEEEDYIESYAQQKQRRFRYCHCKGTMTPTPSRELLESIQDKIKTEKMRSSTGTTLPPLYQVQGPFKDPARVLWQKVKPLEPSVRVASDFKTVERARLDRVGTEGHHCVCLHSATIRENKNCIDKMRKM